MNVWISVLAALWMTAGAAMDSMEGTWKIREPLTFETDGEVCEVRRGVAHLRQDGDQISGRYEAHFSCWSRHSPDPIWQPRVGTVEGRLNGTEFDLSVNVGDPIPIRLLGTVHDGRMQGQFAMGEWVTGQWSAARIATTRPRAR